ncbi:MAG: hypothetical protein VX460_01640 [Planctomycetota bacterium]|nr:hypothetical protein [Planctomycetota bacterium]
MKYTQRLDYGRLAEVLHERGLAELDAIRELLQLSHEGDTPFCEALVTSNVISDWDLSRVVCETFQLPFLPVELVTPNAAAIEEIDADLFREHQLVPIDLFGQILTVAMPALVPAEVLARVSAMTDFTVLPVVGTVESNRRWIDEFMAPAARDDSDEGWESMFDAADAEVAAAHVDDGAAAQGSEPLAPLEDAALGSEPVVSDESFDLDLIEALSPDDLETDPVLPPDDAETAGPLELPPTPEFGRDRREAG